MSVVHHRDLHIVNRSNKSMLLLGCTIDGRNAGINSTRKCHFIVHGKLDKDDTIIVQRCNIEHSCIFRNDAEDQTTRERMPALNILQHAAGNLVQNFEIVKKGKVSHQTKALITTFASTCGIILETRAVQR